MSKEFADNFDSQVNQADRFEFGRNWSEFLKTFSESRARSAEASLIEGLGFQTLENKTFIDVGSGSGLFSLAAKRLGARVFSFDFDPMSVDCALKLKSTFFQNDDGWSIEQGSILDTDYVSRLGKFDIVYSWGVLHHTGDMWQSIENATTLVEQDGMLFISIYNDQGGASKRWRMLKKAYNKWRFLRPLLLSITFLRQWHLALIKDFLELKPFRSWKAYKVDRGMSPWIDIIDWAGGYPFEVAKPEQIFNAITKKGFVLTYLKTCGGGIGCNEFAFKKL